MSNVKANGYECIGVFKDENGNKIIKLVREDGQVSLIEYTGRVDDQVTFDVHYKTDCAVILSQEFKDLLKEDNELNFGDTVTVDMNNLDPNHSRGDISELSGETYFIVEKNVDFTGRVEYVLGTKIEPETTDDKVMYNCWTPHTFIASELKRV